MLTFFLYLMKSVLCLALFYPFYMVLLSRETFHRFNRMALIGILGASVAIPTCRITTEEPLLLTQLYQRWENWLTGREAETVAVAYVDWTEMEMAAMPIVEEEILLPTSTFSPLDFLCNHWIDLLFIIYVGGILFLLGRHIVSIIRLFALLRQEKMQRLYDGTLLYLHQRNDIAPFSWMKYIVISEADYHENGHQIVAHEQAHISNGHSWDLLFIEVCLLAQWFNPVAWLIRQELQNIHEYEADDTVLRQGINAKEYQLLIIKKAVGARLYSLANSLNHSSLKKRLTMMMKEKSHPWARLKYLYVLPLAAISMVAFAHTEAANNSNGISEAKSTEVLANDQTSSEKSLGNKGSLALSPTKYDGPKPIILVNGLEFKGNTDNLDYDNMTNEDLMKVLDVESIEQIEVVTNKESLIKLGLEGNRPVILIATKKSNLDVAVVHVDDNGEYAFGFEGHILKKASLKQVKEFIEAVQLNRIGKQQEKPLLRVSLSVDKNAPTESVEKLKATLRESHISNLEYNTASEQKKPLTDHLKQNGHPQLNMETNANEVENTEEVFMVVEEMPEFPSGMGELMKFLQQNMKYPEKAQKEGVQGRVIVQFIVEKTGKIANPTILKSVSPELDAEAIRVINAMPLWQPGKQKGEAVNVKFTIPIIFRLNTPESANEEKKSSSTMGKNISEGGIMLDGNKTEKNANGEEVFQVVEKMPEYPGGMGELMKFLQQNMKYPEKAQKEGVQGRVIVQFIVDKTGKITNPTILRSVSPELDAEAIRVVNALPLWQPGEQKGEAVNVKFTLPMTFRLNNGQSEEKTMLMNVNGQDIIVHTNLIQRPQYPEGHQAMETFIRENMKYDKSLSNKPAEYVILSMLISKEGKVLQINDESSKNPSATQIPELKAEAMRIAKAMPKNGWKPAQQNGKPVNALAGIVFSFPFSDLRNSDIQIKEK